MTKKRLEYKVIDQGDVVPGDHSDDFFGGSPVFCDEERSESSAFFLFHCEDFICFVDIDLGGSEDVLSI